ncbi:Homeobox protein MSX-1 Protein [Fasciola gigantica]|uniref:Homeobox protein MSX-1 Protein n=1 Tax=Fasciola gigantica TaxID=46835 RepID=A0A504YP76_FASGI|nr:Homeobox protein MSX-1 Protein [Fasciola gigantica]
MNAVDYNERGQCAFSIDAILHKPQTTDRIPSYQQTTELNQMHSMESGKLFSPIQDTWIREYKPRVEIGYHDLLPQFQLIQNNLQFCTWFDTPISTGRIESTGAPMQSGPSYLRTRHESTSSSATRSRSARIPFTTDQVHFLELKFSQSPYLSGYDVTELAKELQLSETRIKIWFQNRRARERRDAQNVTSFKTQNQGALLEELPVGLNRKPNRNSVRTKHFKFQNDRSQSYLKLPSENRSDSTPNPFHPTPSPMSTSADQFRLLNLHLQPTKNLFHRNVPFSFPGHVCEIPQPTTDSQPIGMITGLKE